MGGPRIRHERLGRLLNPRGQLAQFRHVLPALGLVWRASPRWTLATLALLAGQGALPVANVYLVRALVDGLVAVTGGGSRSIGTIVVPAVLLGLTLVVTEALTSLAVFVRTNLAEQVQTAVNHLVHLRALDLDCAVFESSASYDRLHRVRVDAVDRPLALLESVGGIAQHAITLVAMGGILLSAAWWMPWLLVGGTLPALWVTVRSTWRFQRWRLAHTLSERRLAHYHFRLTSDQAAAELRLFGLGPVFAGRYLDLRAELFDGRLRLLRQQLGGELGAAVVGVATLGLAVAYVGWRALAGLATLGDVAMFYQAMNQGQQLMRRLLTGVGNLYRSLVFLEDLFEFLALEPQVRDPDRPVSPPPGLREGIRLSRVTFRYPDSQTAALAGFDLEIPAGRVMALVGENGAGKSTLLKLLCRFYDPQEGAVTWDGVDLRAMTQADLRRRITVLFQRPEPYHETAHDNIAFGDVDARPGRAEVEAAAGAAAADPIIARLPEGYDTVLGRWFGYRDLSIGEWQRLALARAFIRRADLVILDEPTSAMDSWAEAAWMSRFRDLVRDRTAVIVTHRFTTAMQADIIHVVHEGRIVESGTHAELVALGGRYAVSWANQTREALPGTVHSSAGAGGETA